MSFLLKAFVKTILPIPKLKNCKSLAFVGPHPDDLEIACGGTVARFVAEGKRVCFIIATDGRYGSADAETVCDELAETRRLEAINSAKKLGVTDVRFLGFPDGGNYSVDDLKDALCVQLADFKPDLIFCPDNHLKSETHPDHIKTGRAAEIALLQCASPLYMRDLGCAEAASPKGIAYYYTDKPNTYVKMAKYFALKEEALREHKSQFLCSKQAEKDFSMLLFYFKFTAVRLGLRRLCRGAEGFRVLANIHVHCAPEASNI